MTDRSPQKPDGFVIIVVLCMTILLGVLLFAFNHKTRKNLDQIETMRDRTVAMQCATAGLNTAIAAVQASRHVFADDKTAHLLTGRTRLDIAGGSCRILVRPDNGRINLNGLRRDNGKIDRTRVDQLLRLIDLVDRQTTDQPRIGYGLVAALIDWTDADEETTVLPFIQHENLGAESDYYANLETPYRCANRNLDMIEELLLIKGVDESVFERIKDFVTVRGDTRVNINHAPPLVIESLSPLMDRMLAQIIVERRSVTPFETIDELQNLPGMNDEIYEQIRNSVTVQDTGFYYRVEACGARNQSRRTIHALLHRNPQTGTIDIIRYEET